MGELKMTNQCYLDRVLFWKLICYVLEIIYKFGLNYYQVLRGRVKIEQGLWNIVKEEERKIKLINIYFLIWVLKLVKEYNILNIVSFIKLCIKVYRSWFRQIQWNSVYIIWKNYLMLKFKVEWVVSFLEYKNFRSYKIDYYIMITIYSELKIVKLFK